MLKTKEKINRVAERLNRKVPIKEIYGDETIVSGVPANTREYNVRTPISKSDAFDGEASMDNVNIVRNALPRAVKDLTVKATSQGSNKAWDKTTSSLIDTLNNLRVSALDAIANQNVGFDNKSDDDLLAEAVAQQEKIKELQGLNDKLELVDKTSKTDLSKVSNVLSQQSDQIRELKNNDLRPNSKGYPGESDVVGNVMTGTDILLANMNDPLAMSGDKVQIALPVKDEPKSIQTALEFSDEE